jgi:predicted HD superfamily hydrolase involved in NAD metabolism
MLTSEQAEPAPAGLDAAERERLVSQLTEYLGQGRVQHSQNVAEAARELALRFAPELAAQAETAGLVHDSAKKLRDTQLMTLAKRFDIDVTPGERDTPQLLHGKVGAALLGERFGLTDPAIATAVADHVCGRAEMGTLSQLLFVADQIAADRDFPGVVELRELAQRDLARAVWHVAGKKIEHVLQKGQWLEPATVAVWNKFRPPSPQGE